MVPLTLEPENHNNLSLPAHSRFAVLSFNIENKDRSITAVSNLWWKYEGMYAILLCVSPKAPIKHGDEILEHAGQRIFRNLREVLAFYLIRGPVLRTYMGLLSFGALSCSPACS